MNRGLPEFWGRREHGQFQLREQGKKGKCRREQGKKRFREHGNKDLLCYREDKKKEKKDVTGTYLATFSFLFFNLFSWSCGSG